jgi:hypothetical protein
MFHLGPSHGFESLMDPGPDWSVGTNGARQPRTRPDQIARSSPVSAKADRRLTGRKSDFWRLGLGLRLGLGRREQGKFSGCEVHPRLQISWIISKLIVLYHMVYLVCPALENGVTGAMVATWRSEISPVCISPPDASCQLPDTSW